MKAIIPFLFAIASITTIHTTANAATTAEALNSDESLAMQAAITARNEFVQALVKKDFVGIAHLGFEHAINDLAEHLRTERNDAAAADELTSQWQEASLNFEATLFSLAFDDLGDHAPLFAWIEVQLNKLADKYGSIILKLPVVQNIRTMNFAIPVVFTPKGGKWHIDGQDDRIEYRKHFIPFANIVTYYVSLYGCNVIAARTGQTQLKKICKKAAEKLQFVMGRYIAPKISDFIYKAANRNSNRSIAISRQELRYNTPEELAVAIQSGNRYQ